MRMKRLLAMLVAGPVVSLSLTAVVGATGEGAPDAGPAGTPVVADAAAESRAITTGGTTYEPQLLTRFISGTEFTPYQGTSLEADLVRYESPDSACVSADPSAGGVLTEFRAGVPLPDGARIRQVAFYGQDSDASEDIGIRLSRTTFTVSTAPGAPFRSFTVVDAFSTSGSSGNLALAGANNLSEVVGSVFRGSAVGVEHYFHTLHVQLWNSSSSNHKLCGVEVLYQVPIAANPGTVFHPIGPVRAFDSRVGAYAGSGILPRNASRVISVKDGHNFFGNVTLANAVPAGATAVSYNITITAPTGPNFVSVTPGNATAVTTSAVNFNGSADVANAGVVTVDAERRIKVWNGIGAGSVHFIIDVTGYYAAPIHPNMGN